MVKFVKVFLSLHSVQLVFISAFLITYLAVTATNRTETANLDGNAPITEEESVRGAIADTKSVGGEESIKSIASQRIPAAIILQAPMGLETEPVTGKAVTMSDTESMAESWENESGSAMGQRPFDRQAGLPLEP